MSAAVADLAQHHTNLTEGGRLDIVEAVLRWASSALRCLYPEPAAAGVEDKLMRLVLTAEVDC